MKAFKCVLNLMQFLVSLSKAKEKETKIKENSSLDQIVELQKQMVNQMKQQHEFLEKQEMKEKEISATVKLSKLDMIPFSGDKLRWSELWDAFENAVHNNKRFSNIEKFIYLKNVVKLCWD